MCVITIEYSVLPGDLMISSFPEDRDLAAETCTLLISGTRDSNAQCINEFSDVVYTGCFYNNTSIELQEQLKVYRDGQEVITLNPEIARMYGESIGIFKEGTGERLCRCAVGHNVGYDDLCKKLKNRRN